MIPTAAVTRFQADGAVLECSLVPWDSEIFGFPVAQISRLELAERERGATTLRDFAIWCADRDVRLVSCRLDHTQLRESMALEEAGFRFVEMVHEPHLDLVGDIPAPSRAIAVDIAANDDLAAIEDIAYSAFSTGRFLLDWRLPPEFSKRRYATWVRNSLGSSEQTVLKAELEGELVGFFIVEDRSDGIVYWHLTAVAPRWQGKGVGLSLWRTMLQRHLTERATAVETTISGHNAAAINLYARLGFTFGPAKMTFHWLRDPRPDGPEAAS